MKNSQLITLFLSLSGKEKRAINKVVISPFFNQRQEVIDLWRYLVEQSKEGSPALMKERIFEAVFPKQKFDDKRLRHVSSWLLQTIEEYLAYAEYKSTPVIETLHKAKVYKQKKQEKYFQKTRRAADQQLKKMPQGLDLFYFDYRLKFENYSFVESKSRITENNLRLMNEALDKYLLMSKLKQACIVYSHQSVFTTEYDFQLVNILLDFLTDSIYLKTPGIAGYYYCYKALSEQNEICFYALLTILQKDQTDLPEEDLEYLYFSAINFCIRKINTGEIKYRREVFDLYQSCLLNGFLFDNGELSRFTYNNIVSAGLKLNEFEWLEYFIHQYKPMVHAKFRDSNFNYNLARLFFKQEDYDRSMEHLYAVDEQDLFLFLDTKVLLMKIYFERNEYDALSSLLSSFSVMLRRKKILSYHKKHYQSLIRFTNRLLNLPPSDKKAKEKLITDIQQAEVLGQREWLLAQLK